MDEQTFDYADRHAAGALAGGQAEDVEDAVEFAYHSYFELMKARQQLIDDAEE